MNSHMDLRCCRQRWQAADLLYWPTVEVKTMRWVIYSCLTDRLLTVVSVVDFDNGTRTYNFLGPEGHLSVTEMMMGINPIGVIYETVPMMCLVLDGSLELVEGPDLGVLLSIWLRWNITFPLSLFQLFDSGGFASGLVL